MRVPRLAALSAASLGMTLALTAQQPAPCDAFCHSRLADQAEAAGDFMAYQAHVRAVAAIAPSHPGVVYAMARAFARAGAPDSAVGWLARLGRMGDTRDPDADSLLRSLRALPGYADARNRLLANRLPILDGKLAFELADPDFLPEALDYDAPRDRFIVGSLAKRELAEVAPNGAARTLIAPTGDILRVVGVHIDQARGRLWFATWAPDSTWRGDSTNLPSVTRLFLADPATGRVLRSWSPDGGRAGHLLNDFVILKDGSLILTDTEQGSLYRLRSPTDTLELFLQPDRSRFTVANGIAATPDGGTLYVAFLEGVARVDMESRRIELVPAPDSASTASVDGLYWHRGSLLAVQGALTLQRVVRFVLSRDGRHIEQSAVLERGLPVVHRPTTGTIVGSRFYYIANSQYDRLSDTGGPLQHHAGPAVRTAIRVIDLRW